MIFQKIWVNVATEFNKQCELNINSSFDKKYLQFQIIKNHKSKQNHNFSALERDI